MKTTTFDQPPVTRNPDGSLRSVGFELEFAGPPIEDVVDVVRRELGGDVERLNLYRYEVETGELGTFKIELDWALLSDPEQRRRVRELVDSETALELVDWVEEVVAELAQTVVPIEVVSPPIPLDRLDEMERLRSALRELGARGTGDSLVYAFGMHLNPEAPSFEPSSIQAHLQAFLLLQDWLEQRHEVDLTRRLTPYVNPFPKAYVQRAVGARGEPTLDELIDGYLEDNATRNRPLDLLPLFAHLDEERVRGRLDDPLVGSRPAYHYRLPGCRVDQEDWSLAREWNLWLTVERLAADPPRLEEMCSAYLEQAESPLRFLGTPWVERVAEWL